MTLRFRRTWLLSTVALAGLAFVASGLTARAATLQKEEKVSREAQAKKENPEAAELEKIEAKLRGLEQEIKELRAAGKDEAAEKLARAGRELKVALQKQDAGKERKDVDGRRDAEVQLKRLAAEIAELKAAGKLDAAEKLEREAGQLKEKLAKRDGDAAKKPDEKKPVDKKPEGKKPTGEGAELAAKIDAMQHEAAKLREAGRTDEAEKVLRQVAELRGDANKKPDEKKPVDKKPEGKKPPGEGAELAAKIDAMQHEAAKLREAGRTDEAEKILSQVAELRARSKLDDGKGKPEKDKPRDDGKRTNAWLEARIAELKAAGKDEEAKALLARAMKIKGEQDKPMKGEDVKRDKPGAAAGSPELAAAVKELREEVSRLRNEVAELRKIVGKEKRDEPRREKGEKKDDDDKKDSKKAEKKDDDKKDVKKIEKKDDDDKKDSKTDK